VWGEGGWYRGREHWGWEEVEWGREDGRVIYKGKRDRYMDTGTLRVALNHDQGTGSENRNEHLGENIANGGE